MLSTTEGPDPWQRALDGLNALVDAGIDHHIVGGDQISALDGDTGIVWDYDLERWRLVNQSGRATATAVGVDR